MAHSQTFTDLERHTLGLLSQTYAEIGEFEEAYHYLQEKAILDQKSINEEKIKQIVELEVQYQAERKNTQITELALEKSLEKEKNKAQLWLFLFILMLLVVGMVVGYILIRQRQKLKLQQLQVEQQRRQTQVILEAEEKEAARIARELHDGVGQLIAATRLNLASVEAQNDAPSESLSKAVRLLDETSKEVRQISHNLLPALIEKQGLESAIRQLVASLKNASGPTIQLEIFGLHFIEEPLMQTMIYRIVQEVISNTFKHANASVVSIQLYADEQLFSILIEDDGVGMNPAKSTDGIGLKNIRARAQVLNAQVEWNSMPGKGTTFVLEMPLTKLLKSNKL